MTTDRHADDCPGHPKRGEVYDSYPPMYAYVCSECGKSVPGPETLKWPSWPAHWPVFDRDTTRGTGQG